MSRFGFVPILICACCFLVLSVRPACGQELPATLSVGLASLRTSTPSDAALRQLYFGLEIGLTVRIRRRWALDAEGDFLSAPAPSAWLQETLVGIRYRLARSRNWAVYLAARPGWLYLTGFGEAFFPIGPEFNFAFDLGGSWDFRLSRRWLWRVQAGDLLIRDPSSFLPADNLRASTGVAFRF